MPLGKTLISGPYGSEVVPVSDSPAAGASLTPQVRLETVEAPISDAVLAQQPGFAQARAAREAELNRPESTMLEGAGAAVSLWSTTRLVKRLARPVFEEDRQGFNQFEAFEQLGMALSPDEREYISEVGKGPQSWQYAVQQVQDIRDAQRVFGDHPIVGFATSFLDPVWLVVPPAIRAGKLSPVAGRAVSAAAGAAGAGAITAAGEGPVSDADIALNMLMGAAGGAVFYKHGKLTHIDPEFPVQALDDGVRKAEEAVVAQKPVELAEAVQTVDRASQEQPWWAWNTHKTMSSFGDYGKQVADLLYDNNADLSINSLESHREAILHDLRVGQHAYEDQLRKAMSEDGFGFLKMANPFTSREAAAAQQSIEREVQRELFRREQATRNGTSLLDESVPRRITEMADTLDAMHKRALAELKAAGVEGAENLLERPGYLNRKWSSLHIDNAIKKLEDLGLPNKEARAKVTGLVSLSLRRANGWDKELSDQIGSAIIDRALRKGYFEDTLFNVPAGEGQLKEMRDILSSSGMNAQQVERALDVMRVQTDEAGKAGIMKHRMDLDYRAQMRVGNETLSVMDLIDGRVATIVDQYNAQVATQAAFARKGFKRRSDIEGIRSKLLASVPAEQRRAAQELFDATIAHFRGEPAGAAINDKLRLMQAYGRSISLAWSGLWQMTEFANPMAQYGLMKTLKYAAQEIPGFKQIMNPTKAEARTLADVLADHSASSQRLRPYISRFEDGYEMDATNAMQLSAQTIGQSVPYANAMKNVHHFQAKVVGNLILDRLRLAAEGNPKAREALATYGLESPVMDKLKIEIDKHGFNVDAWDDNVWMAARPAFSKMMDSAVLRGRLGDVPAFAAFDPLGKFLFTYRSFVLVAHNKVLAGTYMREGAGAVGLALMYQFPLALAAVQAQSVLRGQGALSSEDATKKAMGQMGGIGLFSEPLKWATGESSEWGSPGTIPIDRGIRMFGNVLSGDGNAAASTALTMLPTVSAVPFINGMAKAIKE